MWLFSQAITLKWTIAQSQGPSNTCSYLPTVMIISLTRISFYNTIQCYENFLEIIRRTFCMVKNILLCLNLSKPWEHSEATSHIAKPHTFEHTYIFKPIFAELNHEMKKDQGWEPQTPHDHFFYGLHIQHSKYENELVEDEVPEFILEMLIHKKTRWQIRSWFPFPIVYRDLQKPWIGQYPILKL